MTSESEGEPGECVCAEKGIGGSLLVSRAVERSVRRAAEKNDVPITAFLTDANWRKQLTPRTRKELEEYISGTRRVHKISGHLDVPLVTWCPVHDGPPRVRLKRAGSTPGAE